MRVLVAAETAPKEARVALVPAVATRLVGQGWQVSVTAGAGRGALAADADYEQAGAEVVTDVDQALPAADIVVSVQPLPAEHAARMRPGAVSLSLLQPGSDVATVAAVAAAGASLLSFHLLPRISRAQAADALTSQAIVTGYRAVLVGAGLLPHFLGLSMTAAGTIRPARVLVLGAGVAGLQAMATARRLGALVSGYDVRPASADEVRSVGATFIDLGLPPIEGAGGYAREMDEERATLQRERLAEYIATHDLIITTAAVPGRRAPVLITPAMLAGVRRGTVVIDLAAESGGNVEGSAAGSIREIGPARVWGAEALASEMAPDASFLYAGNVAAMLGFISPGAAEADVASGPVPLDTSDEVIAGCAVVINGEVVNPVAQELLSALGPAGGRT